MSEPTDKMAVARAAIKKPGKKSSAGEILKRVGRAFGLLAFHRPMEVRRMLMKEFKCGHSAADNVIRRAKSLMQEEAEKTRVEQFALTLCQLDETIFHETGTGRVAAIRAKIDLLGLAAATKVDVGIVTYDPASVEAMADPIIRHHVLELEREVTNFPLAISEGEPSDGEETTTEDSRDHDTRGSCC